MLGKLVFTSKGNLIADTAAVVVGLLLVIAVTALESGLFSLMYGVRSTWRQAPAARAVFWAVLAYFVLATVLLIGFFFPWRFDWFDDVRELAYLGLSVAGLNLVLTLVRVLKIPPR